MPRHHDFRAHFGSPLHDGIKIVHLKPQQHAISVWFVITISNGAVMMLRFETVQLKNKLAVPHQLFICGAAVIALATQQTLVPTAARFHIRYSD